MIVKTTITKTFTGEEESTSDKALASVRIRQKDCVGFCSNNNALMNYRCTILYEDKEYEAEVSENMYENVEGGGKFIGEVRITFTFSPFLFKGDIKLRL